VLALLGVEASEVMVWASKGVMDKLLSGA